MSTFNLIGGLAGGVGLFLLGMGLMTDGLKLAAGPALGHILTRSTQTRLRGLLSGVLITGLVQSSSAVTMAAIGFVNAGLLTLGQALWVLFGANVGTTLTGWLVALLGLQFKIDAMALPLVGAGAVLTLIGPDKRLGAIGKAFAGFGLLFLGIDMLKGTFVGLSADLSIPTGDGVTALALQAGIGIVLTVLMQSSSASLAVALTAAQGGLLSPEGAAAMVIGANIGTTTTAVVAALGATANAKRASVAHVVFNLFTGIVAFLILPWLMDFLHWLQGLLQLDAAPATQVALFHTLFNVLGVLLIWPLTQPLTDWLNQRFQGSDGEEGRPRFIDKNVLAVPSLALDALAHEIQRMERLASDSLRTALTDRSLTTLVHQQAVVAQLSQATAEFIVSLSRSALSAESAERLPRIMRVARYFQSAISLALESVQATNERVNLPHTVTPAPDFQSSALHLLQVCADAGPERKQHIELALADTEDAYQTHKAQLLQAGAQGQLAVRDMDAMLRSASSLRRGLEQMAKGVMHQSF